MPKSIDIECGLTRAVEKIKRVQFFLPHGVGGGDLTGAFQ